ncbi:hypothetical protein [Actinoplanes sichuanensis]|uniref:Transposase n=1 Tax=Actinoplanes sichuanensis TaxID=512349 RepID=A0ABW4ATL7_9ACTN
MTRSGKWLTGTVRCCEFSTACRWPRSLARPAPLDPARRARLTGARTSTSPLPPPPAGPLRAVRRVPADGVAMVAGQRLRVGRTYAGQTVTVMIEDTVFRVLLGDVEISTHARTSTKPVTRFKATARNRSS